MLEGKVNRNLAERDLVNNNNDPFPPNPDGIGTPPPPPPFGGTPDNTQPERPGPYGYPGATPPPPPPIPPQVAPAQGTYYSNEQGYNAGGPKNDPFAITALSTGVPAIVLACCCGIFGVILGVVATAFGFLSLGRIEKSGGQLTGKGLAIGGLSCGIAGIIIGIGLLILNLVFNISSFQPQL